MSTPKQPRKKRRLDPALSKEDDSDFQTEKLNAHRKRLSLRRRKRQEQATSKESLQEQSLNNVGDNLNDKDSATSKSKLSLTEGEQLEPQCSKSPNNSNKKREISKKKRSLPGVTFSTASKLWKESCNGQLENVSLEAGNTSCTDSLREECPSDHISKLDKCPGVESNIKSSKLALSQARMTRSSKSKFSGSNFSNKILNYFKPTASAVSKRKIKSSVCSGEPSNDSHSKKENGNSKSKSKLTNERRNQIFFEKSKYNGLEESGEDQKERICYFDLLPQHVLECIFCQVPFEDLMKMREVCTTWNEVIKDKSFMDWKKLYYGFKYEVTDCITYMCDLLKVLRFEKVEDCFGVLLRYMSDHFNKKPSSDMCDLLAKHPKGVDAELVLNERFPELLKKESKPWCILTAAILVSETVNDVYSLYKVLVMDTSDCSLHDITNAMYCVASFLLHYKKYHGINHGLHYRIFNALYWVENKLPLHYKDNQPGKGLPGQQSIHNYCETSKSSLTYEQLRIINHQFKPKQIIKIVALAGTGKTTTLVHLARLYPQVNFLNVMFNRSVCEYAKKTFPENVTCRTAHSLAYEIFGSRLKSKLSLKIRPHDLVTLLQHNDASPMQTHTYAKHVLNTIESFIVSADAEITLEHVPTQEPGFNNPWVINPVDRAKILKDALQIWGKMIDKEEKSVKITHDTYLKLYQLSKPKLSRYQCVMVDEAQDCNPAMLHIILSQKLPVILVGDPNQQIYGFRGANNALQSVDATHIYYLTKSFRFGPEISYIATCVLDVLKTDNTDMLMCSDKPSYIDGRIEGQYAIIARTNAHLFNEAVRLVCFNHVRTDEPSPVIGHFAGGLRGYGFDQMLAIWQLLSSEENNPVKIKDKFISKFRSFKELTNYAKSVEDAELLAKLDLVTQHRDRLVDYIKTIKRKCSNPLSAANVVFSTAHKSKGLEFDTVCLTDDYPIQPGIEYRRQCAINEYEETNVVYVALTRAKKSLRIPDKMLRVLLTAQEKFEYPVRPSSVLKDGEQASCANCHDNFTPHTALVLCRRSLTTGTGKVTRRGIFCVVCATYPILTIRGEIENGLSIEIMHDITHRTLEVFLGPLPNEPPIRHKNIEFHVTDEFIELVNEYP